MSSLSLSNWGGGEREWYPGGVVGGALAAILGWLVWAAAGPGAVLSIPCLMSSRRLWRAALVLVAVVVVLAVAMTARRLACRRAYGWLRIVSYST